MSVAEKVLLFLIFATSAVAVLRRAVAPVHRGAREYPLTAAIVSLDTFVATGIVVGLLHHSDWVTNWYAAAMLTSIIMWPVASIPLGAIMLAMSIAAGILGHYSTSEMFAGPLFAIGSVIAGLLAVNRITRRSAWGLTLTASTFALIALVAPRLLITSGAAYTSQQVAILPALTLGAAIFSAVFGIFAYRRFAPTPAKVPEQLGALGAAVGLVVATLSLSGTIGNVPPPIGSVPGCQGIQIHSVPFLAETTAQGSNVRSGPSDISAQLQRLGSSCSVGVLGFCRGAPLVDVTIKVRDARWYVLPHHLGLISSTAVQDLSAASKLKALRCSGDVPAADVESVKTEMGSDVSGQASGQMVNVSVVDPSAANVGVAIYRPSFPVIARYKQLILDTKPLAGVSLSYDYAYDNSVVSTSAITLVATTCLAAGVPDGEPIFEAIGLPVNGRPLSVHSTRPPESIRNNLLHSACRYQTGEGIPLFPPSP